jgi:hypothetical protein
MNIREEAIVDLKVDDSDATTKWEENRQRIKEINTELRQLKEAGEKGSEGYKALQVELREVKAEQKELKHNIDLSTASIDQMHAALDYWTKEAKKAEKGSEEWVAATKKIEEIKPVLTEARAELKSFGEEADKQPGFWDNFKASALGAFTGIGLFSLVKEAAGAIFDFGKEIFETTAKFEKYEAILANSLGSHDAANKAMGDIKKMASETPFSVDELTDSYIKYVNRGLQPSMAEMTKLGDIAASQGKSFEQLTEAVLDAGTGEFERLKEFGIQASKSGDEVSLSFKGIQHTVANTPEAIKGAILAFGEMEGVQDSMAVISGTLEGRVSNLGDTFDSIKVTLGEFLMPVFVFFLETIKDGLNIIQGLVDGTIKTSEAGTFLSSIMEGLKNVFGTLWDVLTNVWDVVVDVMGSFMKLLDNSTELYGGTNALTWAMDALRFALNLVGTVLIGALTGVGALVDGFNILVNKGKEVANFFGADFKVDANATFDNLAKNAENNLAKIKNLWVSTANDGAIANKKATDTTTDNSKKAGEAQTANDAKEKDKQKKAAEKLAKDKEKAEADMLKKIADMQVKAIADDTKRAIAKADLDFKREQDAIKKSMASEASKKKALESATKLHSSNIAKINADAQKKQEKLEADARKKEDAERKKDLAEEKKIKAQKLADTKKLLDDEFKAEVANAQVELALTKTNSQAMWDAKLRLLQIETAHKNAKLAQEAAAEKARIAESIADNETKAARLKAVDDALTAQQRQNETQLQTDKKNLQQEANAARQANNTAFYNALNAAMTGDFKAFTTFLQNKARDDGKHLNERSVAFSKYANDVGKVMLTTIEVLTKLNADYTKRQIDNLTKEKDTNFKKLDDELAKGIKTKEQVEAEKTRLQDEFDQKNLALKKKEFERNKKMQIAAALIQGSMAILSALATPPFPLGIALAIVAGVKTAFDISKIKNTKFEARSGGVFRNAGVANGSRHGSTYGQSGIAMYDRMTGAEVGEIEGGEPVMVLSRNTYSNNKPVIDKLLKSSLYNNGAPISMANGGVLTVSRARMFADGGVYENNDGGGSSGGGNYADNSSSASSDAIIAENKKMQEEMKKFQKETATNTAETVKVLKTHTGILKDIASKDNGSSGVLHALDRLKENMGKSKL